MAKAPENFAETVKEVRQQLGLSQEELAHELGVSFSTVRSSGALSVGPLFRVHDPHNEKSVGCGI